jgi:N-acetyl-gamma-glutamylphosphate reductase
VYLHRLNANTVFRTGASGYAGGQLLHELVQSHPEYTIAALVRDAKAAETIAQAYPKVRIVVGDLDNSELVEQEASKASVVLSTWFLSLRRMKRGSTDLCRCCVE